MSRSLYPNLLSAPNRSNRVSPLETALRYCMSGGCLRLGDVCGCVCARARFSGIFGCLLLICLMSLLCACAIRAGSVPATNFWGTGLLDARWLLLRFGGASLNGGVLELLGTKVPESVSSGVRGSLSQDTQPPLTPRQAWTTEVDCQTPARRAGPNFCSTGPALWEFFRKSAVLQEKRPWRTGEKVAKIQTLLFLP